MSIDYSERIPNNVDLSSDKRLQRALEKWQPAFLDWWQTMGPEGWQPRLPAHGDLHGGRRLGELRLCEDARVSLGHLPQCTRS